MPPPPSIVLLYDAVPDGLPAREHDLGGMWDHSEEVRGVALPPVVVPPTVNLNQMDQLVPHQFLI